MYTAVFPCTLLYFHVHCCISMYTAVFRAPTREQRAFLHQMDVERKECAEAPSQSTPRSLARSPALLYITKISYSHHVHSDPHKHRGE